MKALKGLFVCVLLLALALVPAGAWAETVNYINAKGEQAEAEATPLRSNMMSWSDGGWYVVNTDVTINERIAVAGSVNLILADGCTLTAPNGVEVDSSDTLNIYAQSGGTGKLSAVGGYQQAGIGGNDYGDGGMVNIYGGVVTAWGDNGGAGIGGGYRGIGGEVNIHGGVVTVTGDNSGAGIGGGYEGDGGTVNIHGGVVTAWGDSGGAGIGGGANGAGGMVNIHGGVVTAMGGDNAAGIGGGDYGIGGTVTITGGMVKATGGDNAAGIGGGANGDGGMVNIYGGVVTAWGDNGGAGIGGGAYGNGGTVTITGGMVKATGSGSAEHIGKGDCGTGSGSREFDNCLIIEGNTATVYGTYILDADYTIDTGATLTIAKGATLTIPDDVTLTNNGIFFHLGTLIGKERVEGSGQTEHTAQRYDPVFNDERHTGVCGCGEEFPEGHTYDVSESSDDTIRQTCVCSHQRTMTVQPVSAEISYNEALQPVSKMRVSVYATGGVEEHEIAYQWKLNGQEISGAKGAEYTAENFESEAKYSVSVTLGSVSVTGAYTCPEIVPIIASAQDAPYDGSAKTGLAAEPKAEGCEDIAILGRYQCVTEDGGYEPVSPQDVVVPGRYRLLLTIDPDNAHFVCGSSIVEFTISAGSLPYTAEGYSGAYDGQPHGIVVSAEGAEIGYSTDGEDYSPVNPMYTDVGSYTVYYRIRRAHYADVTGTANVEIAMGKQDMPTNLLVMHESVAGMNDGRIDGVSEDMEYRAPGESVYRPISGTALEGLAPGDYAVRYAQTSNCFASDDAVMTIWEGRKAYETDATAQAQFIDERNVTPEQRGLLEQAKAEYETALAQYDAILSPEEKELIHAEIARINDALSLLDQVSALQAAIVALPAAVEPDDMTTVAAMMAAKEDFAQLSEHAQSLLDQALILKLNDLLAMSMDYRILEGDNGSAVQGDGQALRFKANGALEKLVGVKVDNVPLDAQCYEVSSGSTIVILKPEYLQTLEEGWHTLTVCYTDGEAGARFEITAPAQGQIGGVSTAIDELPQTGDSSRMPLMLAILLLSTTGLAALARRRRA